MNGTYDHNDEVIRLSTRISNSIGHLHKSILLTGVSEKDPVGLMAYELARTLVCLGNGPVLLVEANFSSSFRGVKANLGSVRPGLLDVLRQEITLSETVFPDELPGLFHLPAGSTDCDYHVLLLSDQCGELMKEMRQDYAFVIIASASILNHAECLHLSSRVDGVAVVVQPGLHQQSELAELKHTIDGFQLPLLGVIFCSPPGKKLRK